MKKMVMCLTLLMGLSLSAATPVPRPINPTPVKACYEEGGSCAKCVRRTVDMFNDDDQWDLFYKEENDPTRIDGAEIRGVEVFE